MNIIWLGHGSFRIEIGDQVLLVDPWLNGNPMMEDQDHAAAIQDASHILVTHGHFDHTVDIVQISKDTGAPVSAIYELAGHLHGQGAVEGHAFNLGGTITLGDVEVHMVPAAHSSSIERDGKSAYMGRETGFILKGEGRSIYLSGDTAPMADMAWIAEYYLPDVGILSAGGYYTMDMKLAAFAARKYFDFKTVIPCHYRTFPALEQSAELLSAGLPGVEVIEPEVMQPIAL
ncbi:metal-dependent hydrolase [Primorskyibacter sp. S187A]|uniref:metal-dependent hydrolase n=1 Tax=Primorskyibacter sp. S187A TaxID=3415130 RepID=UPI003C79A0E1